MMMATLWNVKFCVQANKSSAHFCSRGCRTDGLNYWW